MLSGFIEQGGILNVIQVYKISNELNRYTAFTSARRTKSGAKHILVVGIERLLLLLSATCWHNT